MIDLGHTLAVTRNGRGDIWVFPDQEAAWLHPIVQYGDAVMSGPSDIRNLFKLHEINSLLEKMGDEDLRVRVMQDLSQSRTAGELDEMYQRHSMSVWQALHCVARTPPVDPKEVIDQIVHDRVHYNHGLKETTMTTKTEEKPKAEPKKSKYAEGAKITMLADKDGKKYGKGNNPKRVGSKSHARFEAYGEGTTVGEFLKAGGTVADLAHDSGKGFIKIG